METGVCPACARPYTSGEVTGLGILRSRPEARGGPYVEFSCPGCGRQILLIPHGEGRFAPPGAPPPETVPADQRRVPWAGRREARRRPGTPAAGPAPEDSAPEPVVLHPPPAAKPPPSPGSGPPASPARTAGPEERVSGGVSGTGAADPPMTVSEAIGILGVPLTADRKEIEKAFRERSLACHPDKVAHLDAEFQALAERKFRRLRQAFGMLVPNEES